MLSSWSSTIITVFGISHLLESSVGEPRRGGLRARHAEHYFRSMSTRRHRGGAGKNDVIDFNRSLHGNRLKWQEHSAKRGRHSTGLNQAPSFVQTRAGSRSVSKTQ